MSSQNPLSIPPHSATHALSIRSNLATILLFASFILISERAYGWTSPHGNWGLLEAERLDMYGSKVWYLNDPYIPEFTTPRYTGERRNDKDHPYNPNDPNTGTQNFEHWLYGAAVGFDLNLIRYKDHRFFWDNYVHMHGTTVQVRHVGWKWKAGVDIVPDILQVYYHHHSQHVMERAQEPHDGYPLLDELVLKMTFYKRKK